MFMLTRLNGDVVRMRDGDPFLYSTGDLAKLGRKALAKHLGAPLSIVPFG